MKIGCTGPTHWGPVVGGEGLRGAHALPRVDTFASVHRSTSYMQAHPHPRPGDEDHEDLYYDSEALANRNLTGANINASDVHPSSLLYMPAGGASEDAEADDPSMVGAMYDWDLVEAERTVYESFLSKNCKTQREADLHKDACKTMQQKLGDIEQFIRTHKPGLNRASNRLLEGPNSFSFFNDGFQQGHDYNLEADHFLSHVGSSLSHVLHQVFTPAVAHHGGPYARSVTFHLYALANHQAYDPLEHGFVERFKSAMEPLRLPEQEFVFVTHRLSMSDDPRLSMAYSNALKAAVVPTLHMDGRFSAIKRLYLDSAVLQSELADVQDEKRKPSHFRPTSTRPASRASADTAANQRRSARASRSSSASSRAAASRSHEGSNHIGSARRSQSPTSHSHGHSLDMLASRVIPIFLFSLSYPLPIFIDKFYQAKALDNMVVAVQSNQRLWESHVACNHHPVYWDLRSPLRSIVASVAQLLGGLLPAHVTYTAAHNRTAQSWLWAIGSNPMVGTSSGLQFSGTQQDAVHRHYVVSALRQVTHAINGAVMKLQQQPTTLGNQVLRMLETASSGQSKEALMERIKYDNSLRPRLHHLQQAYKLTRGHITKIYQDLEKLDFATAIRRLRLLLSLAQRFVQFTDDIVLQAKRYECTSTVEDTGLSSSYWMLSTSICVLVVLYRLIHPFKPKLKIN